MEDEDLIQPKIRNEDVAIVRGNKDRVRMRSCLDRGIDAVPDVLHKGGHFSQRAILLQLDDGDAAATEIGHEYVLAGDIGRNEAGTGSARRKGIECAQLS